MQVVNIGMSTGVKVERLLAHQAPHSMTETIELSVNFVVVHPIVQMI
jgi:phospholipid N-methyltransferase